MHEPGAVVSRSLTQLIRRNPRIGWVRADSLSSPEASRGNHPPGRCKFDAPEGAESLACGDETFAVRIRVKFTDPRENYHDPARVRSAVQTSTKSWDEL